VAAAAVGRSAVALNGTRADPGGPGTEAARSLWAYRGLGQGMSLSSGRRRRGVRARSGKAEERGRSGLH